MPEHINRTIDDLVRKIRLKEEEIAGFKRTVNLLCDEAQRPPVYQPADLEVGGSQLESINSDTFYGQPLNTSIRRILQMRKAAGGGPASVRDIYDALAKGGYQFGGSNDANNIRGLRISLGKSTRHFHKLPNGSFGLAEWYPAVRSRKTKSDGDDEMSADADDGDAADEAREGEDDAD